jgi:serine/threonine protein kinase
LYGLVDVVTQKALVRRSTAGLDLHSMSIFRILVHFSPEQLNGKSYNEKTDIFSLGIVRDISVHLSHRVVASQIFVEMHYVFRTQMERLKVLGAARRGHVDFAHENAQTAREFVKELLNENPAKRPNAKDLLSHPFVLQTLRRSTPFSPASVTDSSPKLLAQSSNPTASSTVANASDSGDNASLPPRPPPLNVKRSDSGSEPTAPQEQQAKAGKDGPFSPFTWL